LVKGKGMSPVEAKRKTMIKVLKLFEDFEREGYKASWKKLWEKAKEKQIPYPTLKRTMARLVEAGLAKVEASLDEKTFGTPIISLLAPLPHLMYLNDIVKVLDSYLDKWHVSPKILATSSHVTFDGYAPSVLFSEDVTWSELKKYVTREDEAEFIKAQATLSEIRSRWTLENLISKEEKQLVIKYEKTVDKLVDMIHEISRGEEIRRFRRMLEVIAKAREMSVEKVFEEYEEAEKSIEQYVILHLDPNKIREHFSKYQIKDDRSKTDPLIDWLKENREVYEKYRDRIKDAPKIVLAIGVGFADYTEKYAGQARMLPLEWILTEKQKADPKFKEKVKWTLEEFKGKTILYYCENCLSMFDKRKKALNHAKTAHPNTKTSIQKIDKSHYLELLNLLD